VPRAFPGVPQLAPLARAALGRDLTAAERVAGGSKKGVYRLFVDGGSAVAYVWSTEEDFWPATASAPDDPFEEASGLELFRTAHDRLAEVGVRTPRLLWTDSSRSAFPADVVVVEDVRGGSLEDALSRSADTAGPALASLREALAALRAARDPLIGKVSRPDRSGRTCERIVLERAQRHLAEAAARVPRLAAARAALAGTLEAAAANIEPRAEHGLVHGELGPDHVLLDGAGRPVVVDIEGLMSFDAEWEHAFLEMRFGPSYEALRLPGLDAARLRLYRLAEHLSLVAGPLRLLDGDFPDREFMLEIAEAHTERALSYVS
jgi:Phosphotransferase enzyme family